MRRGLIFVMVLALACGGAVVAGRATARWLDDRAQPAGSAAASITTTVEVRPPPGQALVRGTVDAFAADGVETDTLASPFTLTAVTRGVGKARIRDALVDGKRTTIVWSAGTPLPISGGGGLDLSGARVDVAPDGITWTPAGTPHPFVPGTYRVSASVAVGEEGLSRPRESVPFTADDKTVLDATNGVVIVVPLARLHLTGPGRLAITGQMVVTTSADTRNATKVELASGPYEVTIGPDQNGSPGLEIDAVIRGDFRAT